MSGRATCWQRSLVKGSGRTHAAWRAGGSERRRGQWAAGRVGGRAGGQRRLLQTTHATAAAALTVRTVLRTTNTHVNYVMATANLHSASRWGHCNRTRF